MGLIWGVLRDLAAVLAIAPAVEWGRRFHGPRPLIEKLRSKGLRAPCRDRAGRQRLRRMIVLVDRFIVPWERRGNCYRRALLELALDSGAAYEPLRIGLMASPSPRSGHAWLGSEEGTDTYDATWSL